MSRKRSLNKPALFQLSENSIVPAINYITESEYKIGRSPDSNLNLPLPYVSRKHCSFRCNSQRNQWYIVSHTNKGVSVRGNQIKVEEPFKLECGDTIKISAILVFEFKCSPDEEHKCCSDRKKFKVSDTDVQDESTAVDSSELSTMAVTQITEPSDLGIASASSVNNLWANDIASPEFQIADISNSFGAINNLSFSNDFQPIDIPSPPDFIRSEISPLKEWIATVPIVSTDTESCNDPVISNDLEIGRDLVISTDLERGTVPVISSEPEIDSNPIIPTEPISTSDSVTTTEYGGEPLHLSDLLNDSDPEPNMVDLKDQIQKYLNVTKKCRRGSKNQKLNEELNYRLTYLKNLEEFRSSCELQPSNSDFNLNVVVDNLKNFSKFFKNEYSYLRYRSDSASKSDFDEQLIQIVLNMDFMLIEKTKSVMDLVLNIFNSSFNKFNTPSPLVSEKSQTVCNVREHDDFHQIQLEKNAMKLEIEKQKENAKWKETRISYLEMKLKEKEMVEQKMESAMEESTKLENQVAELKRSLANMEIMELRYKCLLETSKHREADKRNKDALQKTIDDLKSSNSQLINDKFELNEEIIKLKEKCAQLESKLQEKGVGAAPSCSANASVTEDYCCDMVKEIKGSLIDLMERDFQCCICGEMFVQATVTNCNHVFCSYCLQEWKKKQKRCPFCRAPLSKEVKATIIDEFISGLLKLISDAMYTERMKVIDDRLAAATAAVIPTTVRVSASRGRRNLRRRNASIVVDLG